MCHPVLNIFQCLSSPSLFLLFFQFAGTYFGLFLLCLVFILFLHSCYKFPPSLSLSLPLSLFLSLSLLFLLCFKVLCFFYSPFNLVTYINLSSWCLNDVFSVICDFAFVWNQNCIETIILFKVVSSFTIYTSWWFFDQILLFLFYHSLLPFLVQF